MLKKIFLPLAFLLLLLSSTFGSTEYFLSQSSHLEELVSEFWEQKQKKNWKQTAQVLMKIQTWLQEEEKKNPSLNYVYPVGKNRYLGVRRYTFVLFSSLPGPARKFLSPPESKILYTRGQTQHSTVLLESLLERYPFSEEAPKALYLLGSLYLERGDFGKVLLALEKLELLYPHHQLPKNLIMGRQILCLFRLRQGERARRLLKKHFASLPSWKKSLRDPGGSLKPQGFYPGRTEATLPLPEGKLAQEIHQSFREKGGRVPFPYMGKAGGKTLFFQTARNALAVDWKSREVIWRYSLPTAGDQMDRSILCYYQPAVSPTEAFFTFKTQMEFDGKDFVSGYHLVGFSREGKILWDSRKNTDLQNLFKKAHSVSSPQYAYRRVFFLVTLLEKNFETYLCCLGARKGNILWKKLLSSGLPPNPFGLSAMAAPPLIQGGLVYGITNLGVVSALDIFRGDLKWTYRYETFPDQSREFFLHRGWFWQTSPGLLIDGVYICSPTDSSYVYGLDGQEGKLLWRLPRDGVFLLGGNHQGNTFMAGEKGLICIEGTSGKIKWTDRVPEPVGLWTVGKDLLYYPTADGLMQIEGFTGKILGTSRWRDPLREPGNLFFMGNRLVSTSLFQVRIYESYQESEKKLQEMISNSPNQPESEYSLGELYFHYGHFVKALSHFEKAQKKMSGRDISPYLYRLYRDKAEGLFRGGKFQGAVESFEKALLYASSGSKEFELLIKILRTYQQLGLPKEEIALCRKLMASQHRYRLYPITPHHSVEAGLYARKRIQELLLKQGRHLYSSYEQEARARFQAAVNSGTKEGFVEVIQSYPNSETAEEAYRKLAAFYEHRGQIQLALQTWEKFWKTHRPSSPEILLKISSLQEKLSDYENSLMTLLKLKRTFGKTPLGTTTCAEKALSLISKREYQSLIASPSVPLPPSQLWQTRSRMKDSLSQSIDPKLYRPRGVRPPQMEGMAFFLYEDALECRDIRRGILKWSLALDFEKEEALEGGGFLKDLFFFPTRGRVVALDLSTGKVRWSFQFPDFAGSSQSQLEWMGVGEQRIFVFSQGKKLAALEASTGKVLWQKDYPNLPLSRPVFYKNLLVSAINNPAEILGLDLSTGKELLREKIKDPDPRLSEDLRQLEGDKVLFLLGGRNLICYSLSLRQILWKKTFSLWVHQVMTFRDRVFVSTRQWSSHILCLQARDGKKLWTFQSLQIVPNQIFVDPTFLYIFTGGLRNFEVHAVSLDRGVRKWNWKAPLGERFETMQSDNHHLFLPYLRETPSKVYALSKKGGATSHIVEMKGRKIFDMGVQGGVLMILTNRGDFGFGKVDQKGLSETIVDLTARLAQNPRRANLIQLLAACYYQKGQLEKGMNLLEEAIGEGELAQRRMELIWDQLDGYKEALGEKISKRGKPEYKAPRIYRPIEIDGEINDWWNPAERILLEGPRHVWNIQKKFHNLGNWRGDEDLRGELYFAWDSQNFYFLLKVHDRILRAYDSDHELWKGDCLLIALDFDNSGGYFYQSGDSILSLALQVPKKKNKQQQAEEKKNKPQGKYFVKRTADESATLYEVSLPWSMFKKGGAFLDAQKGPDPGFVFGLNLVVTDDDGGGNGALKSLNLTPGLLLHQKKSKLWYSFVPSYFAKIRLVK